MNRYKVKISFITDYLQARFTEDAKKELEDFVSKGVVKSEEESWKVFLYEDKDGIYIPSTHLRNALVNAGKKFKVKKERASMKQWVISNIIVMPEKIRLNKEEPDDILVSYPARKDGNRVTIKHPVFKTGTEVEFQIRCLDSTMEDKAIKDLIEMAGQMYGIGARRADMYGRFDLVDFKKEK